MTSPGRIADPDGMFSAAPIRPVTRARTPSAGRADIAAITAAPPAMSDFICFIPSLGFRDSPPLSNVIPLPARTMCASAPAGVYVSSIRRGGCAEPAPTATMPPNPAAASSASSRIRTARPERPAVAAAWSASHPGVFTSDGMLIRSRARATASAITAAGPGPPGSGTSSWTARGPASPAPSRMEKV